MKVWAQRFNTYLTLVTVLALFCGCRTERANKPVAALRIHIEASPNVLGTSRTVSVLRTDPVLVTIARQPFLTEANIIEASIIDAPGGYAVKVRFDETGSWVLEQYTATNPGRHLVIFGQWGANLADSRWLAAPLITHRIANGVLAFTPDMSRAEAEQFVLGLNHVAQFNQKKLK